MAYEPELYQCIALSTAHIKPSTCDYLEDSSIDHPFSVMTREEGYFIKLHELVKENLDENTPDELAHLVKFALDLDCRLIELDRDAKVYDELNIYEW